MLEFEAALLSDAADGDAERTECLDGTVRPASAGTELLAPLEGGHASRAMMERGATASRAEPPAMLTSPAPPVTGQTDPAPPRTGTAPGGLAAAASMPGVTSPSVRKGHVTLGPGDETRVTIVETKTSSIWIAVALALFGLGGAGLTYLLVSEPDEPRTAAVAPEPERAAPEQPPSPSGPRAEDTEPVIGGNADGDSERPPQEEAPRQDETAEAETPTTPPAGDVPPSSNEEQAEEPRKRSSRRSKSRRSHKSAPSTPPTDGSVSARVAARAKKSCAATPGSTLEASFTIKSSGETSLVDVPNSDAGRCLERLIRGTRFPEGMLRAGSVTVRF